MRKQSFLEKLLIRANRFDLTKRKWIGYTILVWILIGTISTLVWVFRFLNWIF